MDPLAVEEAPAMSYFPPPSGDPSPFEGEPFGAVTREDARPAAPDPEREPRRRSAWRGLVAGGIAGAILGGGVAFATVKATDADSPKTVVVAAPAAETSTGGATTAPPTSGQATPSPVPAGSSSFDIQAVLAKVSPSVVAIELGLVGNNGVYGRGRAPA